MEKKMAFKLVLGALCACLTVVSFSANAATVYATNSNEITRYDAVTGVLQDSFGFAYNGGGLVFVPSSVPIPPALWLFGSGLLGLVGLARRKKS